MITKCELCERINDCNQHHLIPRTNHKNSWFKKKFTREQMNETITICKRDCHKEIHKLVPNEKELGKKYNTIKKLLSNEKIRKYVNWIKKRKTGYDQ